MAIALGSFLIDDLAVGSSTATAVMLGNVEYWSAFQPNTTVTYADGTVSSFNIEGEFGEESVPNRDSITRISFGGDVTSIGVSALAGCGQLSDAVMPDSITSVGAYAFAGTSISKMAVQPQVSSIGENAFACESLTSLVFKARSAVQVQAMQNYSWGADASIISADLLSPFYIEAIDAGSTVYFKKHTALTNVSFQYSTDNCATWTDYTWTAGVTDVGATITLTNVGDRVYFKAANRNISLANNSGATYVVGTGKLKAGGSVMWLLDGRGLQTNLLTSGVYQNDYAFSRLFVNCTSLYDASDLLLPSNVATTYCYNNMFNGCTSLAAAPALPAMILASNCYEYMFNGCTSLAAAPALPATTLATNCYQGMFCNCTALSDAPALPATTLANYCYRGMFYNCTALSDAPALPATELVEGCYLDMFSKCSSLTAAPELPATELVRFCYQNMFAYCNNLSSVNVAFTRWNGNATDAWLLDAGTNVSGVKTFTCPAQLGTDATIYRSDSHCPNGWTVVNT